LRIISHISCVQHIATKRRDASQPRQTWPAIHQYSECIANCIAVFDSLTCSQGIDPYMDPHPGLFNVLDSFKNIEQLTNVHETENETTRTEITTRLSMVTRLPVSTHKTNPGGPFSKKLGGPTTALPSTLLRTGLRTTPYIF